MFVALVSVSLSIITFYYFRLRRANKKLVKKNLEMALTDNCEILSNTKSDAKFIDTENEIEEKENVPDESIFNDLQTRLETLMVNEKLYLYSDISLDELANRLNTNRAYLSRTINIKYNINFTSYVNAFRIKEAVRFISVGDHKIYNVEGLAQKAGFNNRVSFNKAFHKYTGVTPSFFIKNADNIN